MITEEQKEALVAMKNSIREWALKCEGGIACGENSSLEPDSGDSLLWAGLLCFSGEKDQCSAALASQDSTTGQLYRNPGGTRGTNDSSRDMLVGFLSYLVTTKDQSAASKMVDYLKANDYKLCKNATDNRCDVGPTTHLPMWGTMGKVWKYIGLKATSEMNNGDSGDETIIRLESQFAAEGYPLHLVAIELMLRQATNTYNSTLDSAAKTLLSREPNNPFFEYIANGATSRAAQLVLDKCPTTADHVRSQWAWQRTESEQAWLKSKGWDCIFLANMLLKE
jgi:hypothetical protein